MVARRGLTLLEVLITMGLVLLISGIILGLLVSARHFANRQQRHSDTMRHVVALLDRLETTLTNVEIISVNQNFITYLPLNVDVPIDHDFSQRGVSGLTLESRDGHVRLHSDVEHVEDLASLKPWETLTFSADVEHHFLELTATSSPPVTATMEGTEQSLNLSRRIYIEPPF